MLFRRNYYSKKKFSGAPPPGVIAYIILVFAIWKLYSGYQETLISTFEAPPGIPNLTDSVLFYGYGAIALIIFVIGTSWRLSQKQPLTQEASPPLLPETFTLLLTSEGTILEASESLLKVLGTSSEVLMDKPFWEILEAGNKSQNAIARAAKGEWVGYSDRIKSVTGTSTPVNFFLQPLLNETGEVTHILAEGRANTPQETTEAQFKALVDNSPDVIARYNRNYRNLYINPAMEQERGLPPSTFSGKTFGEKTYQVHIVPEFDSQGEVTSAFPLTCDITQLQTTQNRLRTSETLLAETQTLAHIGSWELDLTTNKLTWSEEMFSIFGLDPDSDPPTIEEHSALFHPDDWETVAKAAEGMQSTDTSTKIRYRIIRPNGEIRYLEGRGKRICNEQGKPIKLIGTAHDITELATAQQSLEQLTRELEQRVTERTVELTRTNQRLQQEIQERKELQERFQNAIIYAPYPIIIHAEDGEILQINQAWTDLTGYTDADIPTLTQWAKKAYGEKKAQVTTKIKEAYQATQRTEAGEYTIRTKWGEEIIWDFSFAPLGRLPDGRKMIISMAKDVTKRKELEQKVRDRESRIHRIIESNMIGIGYWHMEGGILEANDALLDMIGYSHEDLDANRINWQILTPPEYNYKDNLAIQEIRQRGYSTPYEKEYIRRDGKRIPVLIGSCSLEGNTSEGYFFVLNLSQRKRAEKALKKSQKMFQRFMDYSPVCTYIKDKSGHYIFVNRAVEKAWERPLKDWVGKTDFELFAPEIALERVKRDQQVLQENRALECLETTKDEKGTRYWMTVKFPIEDPTKPGKLLIGGKSIDITEQKRAEQALERSEARSQHLVDANIIGVFFTDLSGRIYEANDAFLNMIGYSREELQTGQLRWDDITPPQYAQLDSEMVEILRTVGKTPNFEKEYIRKDGTAIPVLLRVALLSGEEEEGKCVCYAVDISDRKRAQKVLEQYAQQQAIIAQLGQVALSGRELDSLFDLTTDLVASTLGVEYCKVLELLENKEVLLRSGVGWQEGLVGHATVGTDLDSQAGYTLISHEPVIVEDLNSETRFSGPPLLREHGVVSGMSVIIGSLDQPWGILGAHSTQKRTFTPEDINFLQAVANVLSTAIERKDADLAIRELNTTLETRVAERTGQLQEINEELKAFTYTVSHDLRAPLRAIQGFAIALAEDYEDSLDELGLDYTERLVKAAQRLDRLIEDLLNYSRLSRSDLRVRSVNLSQVAEDVQETLAEEIAQKQAKIEVQEPLGAIIGNRAILLQIVANLVTNAIKFVSEDKKPVIRIWSEDKEDSIRLWVEDNGIGISPEHLERIFSVFERLHSVDHYAGTGIGLAIVRKGMERLGGSAGVESHVGKGSKFWIEGKKAKMKEVNLN